MKLDLWSAEVWNNEATIGRINRYNNSDGKWITGIWEYSPYNNGASFLVDAQNIFDATKKVEDVLSDSKGEEKTSINWTEKEFVVEPPIEDKLGFIPIPAGCELYEASDCISDRQQLACQLAELIANQKNCYASDVEIKDNSNGRGKHYHFKFAYKIYKGAIDVYSLSYIVLWSEYEVDNPFSDFDSDDGKILFESPDEVSDYIKKNLD